MKSETLNIYHSVFVAFHRVTFLSDLTVAEASLNPPNLVDSQGNFTPSALVPFCAYDGDMNITGEYIPGLDIPICNKFKPFLLDGQLCYAIDMKAILDEKVTRPGRGFGLTLAIDQMETTTEQGSDNFEATLQGGRLYTKIDIQEFSSSIHLNNLVRYTDSRSGLYKMSVLKKMTGSKGFLSLADTTKGCQITEQLECERKKYLEKVQIQCGCLPWTLAPILASKVRNDKTSSCIAALRSPDTAAHKRALAGRTLLGRCSVATSRAPASMLMFNMSLKKALKPSMTRYQKSSRKVTQTIKIRLQKISNFTKI